MRLLQPIECSKLLSKCSVQVHLQCICKTVQLMVCIPGNGLGNESFAEGSILERRDKDAGKKNILGSIFEDMKNFITKQFDSFR